MRNVIADFQAVFATQLGLKQKKRGQDSTCWRFLVAFVQERAPLGPAECGAFSMLWKTGERSGAEVPAAGTFANYLLIRGRIKAQPNRQGEGFLLKWLSIVGSGTDTS